MEESISRRRTFAIISHPDAGKTTLTEKLLLFGGAIRLAGAVKARGKERGARSDWMKVEQERGISVSVSVMTFDYEECTFNLLDTPGHEDFSEDTYRTITAVDSAVMVIDAAKGIEEQTLKLFEVCRLRDIPIITFINKMDRESLEPLALLEEIEKTLALDVTPATWPIGMGQEFLGCYDLLQDRLLLMDRGGGEVITQIRECHGLEDENLEKWLPPEPLAQLREEVEMVRALCKPMDLTSYRDGHLTPVYFGSALNNFGVQDLLQGLARMAPSPRSQKTVQRLVLPDEEKVTAFIFKIQANMDPKHRDRIAFARICSGHFRKGMKLRHVRLDKSFNIHNPMLFLAQDRELAEDAWPGDIIGLPGHGMFRIGDVLTEGETLHFSGIPSFAPRLLQVVKAEDPMRSGQLGKALQQIGEEGAARVFRRRGTLEWIVGVMGALQFDVLADRVRTEFNIPVRFLPSGLHTARWVVHEDIRLVKRFADAHAAFMADDHEGLPVFLARNAWHLSTAADGFEGIRLVEVLETSTLAQAE
ncbi:MAG: peptide chain release factor 3 [Magnetococcales bacterium]|nr:peptide chain release factor 3 [Magnetococcales bacterium]